MSALWRQPQTSLLVPDWQAEVTQLLDEHHLVAWSDLPARRMQFATSLGRFLGSLRDTEVCVFYGRFITDLDSFCYQLERALPAPYLERKLDGPAGIVSLLRSRASFRGRPETKYRYYIWHDSDVLFRANTKLFSQIVDAMSGVAAEAEYASDDLLLLHRAVYVGGSILDVYAEDGRGQFNSWLAEGPEASDGKPSVDPFWRVLTGLDHPHFMRYRIDQLHAAEEEAARRPGSQ